MPDRFVLALLFLAAPAAFAQVTSASQLEAAYDLLEASNSEANYTDAQAMTLESLTESNPMLVEIRPVMEEFMAEYAGWEHVREEYAAMYARHFSEEEMRSLIEWYRTPLGEKTLRLQPILMQEGLEIGQAVVAEHQAELEARIQAYLRAPAGGDPKKGAQ